MIFGRPTDRRTKIVALWYNPGMPIPILDPANEKFRSRMADISGDRPPCCYQWLEYLIMRPLHMVPSEKDLTNYCKHLASHDKTHVGNGKHNGAWAFTLTKAPTDSLTVGDMIAAVKKVLNQKSCPVKKYAWYLEYKGYDAEGLPAHPHIHGMYETVSGGRIESKHWKRAWKIWEETKCLGAGFRGGYHKPVADETAYTDYIAKDGGIGETNGLE